MRITTTGLENHHNWPWELLKLTLRITTIDLENHYNWPWESLQLILRITTTDFENHHNWPWESLKLALRITTIDLENHYNWPWESLKLILTITTTDLENHHNWLWESLQLTLRITTTDLENHYNWPCNHYNCPWESLQLTLRITTTDLENHCNWPWESLQLTLRTLQVSLRTTTCDLKPTQLCIQILSFSYPRHPSNSSSSSSFLQPLLLQIHLFPANLTIAIHFYSGISQTNLNKLQRIQNSLARVITNTSKYQHITPTLTGFLSNKRIDYKTCLLTYKTLTNQQPTYLYNSLSFSSHSVFYTIFWFACFFHSICPIITWQKGFLCHWSTPLEFTPPWYPKTHLLYQYSVPDSKHTSSKLRSLPRLFPISLDCLPGFWFLLFSFYALSNDT